MFLGPTLLTLLSTTVKLNELLSTCIDACSLGCQEIRSVQAKRKESGSLSKLEFKDPLDCKSALTEADGAAQKAIVDSLRKEWGASLTIVGEEDDDDETSAANEDDLNDTQPLRRDLSSLKTDMTVNLADVTIFVDPLDGTREFVENRLTNCQSLVGIAVSNKAVAGAMGLPFPKGDLETCPSIVYGLVDVGSGVYGQELDMKTSTDSNPSLATGDAPLPVMVAARDIVKERFGGTNKLYGGAGNKILATAFGVTDCTVQHKYGGPWDTCAPEAVIRSMGGKITDLFGDPISVYADSKRNAFGFVATFRDSRISHAELCSNLQENEAVQAYREQVTITPTKD